jgi:hypothetical protein
MSDLFGQSFPQYINYTLEQEVYSVNAEKIIIQQSANYARIDKLPDASNIVVKEIKMPNKKRPRDSDNSTEDDQTPPKKIKLEEINEERKEEKEESKEKEEKEESKEKKESEEKEGSKEKEESEEKEGSKENKGSEENKESKNKSIISRMSARQLRKAKALTRERLRKQDADAIREQIYENKNLIMLKPGEYESVHYVFGPHEVKTICRKDNNKVYITFGRLRDICRSRTDEEELLSGADINEYIKNGEIICYSANQNGNLIPCVEINALARHVNAGNFNENIKNNVATFAAKIE